MDEVGRAFPTFHRVEGASLSIVFLRLLLRREGWCGWDVLRQEGTQSLPLIRSLRVYNPNSSSNPHTYGSIESSGPCSSLNTPIIPLISDRYTLSFGLDLDFRHASKSQTQSIYEEERNQEGGEGRSRLATIKPRIDDTFPIQQNAALRRPIVSL